MGLLSDAFSPLARGDARTLVEVPSSWSFEQAAALPIVYLTACYALRDLADLKAGERVLIHAGAGGVGMAAIGLARRLGGEVFATASPAKWGALEKLGIAPERIASSRDLEFKDKFLSETEGEGMDVVLNALAGEFVDASLELLLRGGRFIEMGKTDIREVEQVAADHPGVSYSAFDVSEAGPERCGEMLVELVALYEGGDLQGPPLAIWDMRRAPEAFRHLREGRNVGKVILTPPPPLDPERTVLISGATGALGSLFARHLVEAHGARHLLLLSRSGEKAEGAAELLAELAQLGAEVELRACDVSDREQLAEAMAATERPLGAILHAAGVLADGLVEEMSPEQLQRVLAAKADAAHHLHELSEGAELTHFVLFSSVAATLGSPGQANYAAANGSLDALAQRRRSEGLPATSIAWGLWERESAMTVGLGEADRARMGRQGIAPITDERGLELFDQALRAASPLAVALTLDRAALHSQAAAGMLPPLLSQLVRAGSRRRSAAAGELAGRLASLPEAEREAYALEAVRGEVATVLGHGSASEVDPDRAFKEMGFDSLAAVELRNRLNAATGLRLGATAVFDYPSPAKLAAHLLAEASESGAAGRVAVRAQASEEPIAIVGMACRYPGGVDSPEALWRLVAEGRDGVSEFPSDRGWDLERLYDPDPDKPGTSYAKEGGFIADVADFDAEFFGIGPREALAMDPQQRLLLEASWEALEDAGIAPDSLRGSDTGVFAGLGLQGYSAGVRAWDVEGYQVTGDAGSVASGRLAYTLGLEGPAMTVDTACSSSLVAMHLAAQALRGGECSLALAGGVTVLSGPGLFTEFARQRGLAPDGRCKSFAEAADGVGWAEGVGALVLCRLSEARREGHPVLATIRGSAVNQDGASNGLTAPNGPSQERVIAQALANARLEAKDIDAVEAHGTGTTLGDPIEAGALLATYGQDRERPLLLGSIKSNIGHTQAAAGVAGVIKMTMAMREGLLPRTLHVDSPSSHVDWEAGEVELLTEQRPWEANGRPRRAGVSSFGISGTNAHLILEQAPEPAPVPAPEEGEGGEGAGEAESPLPGPLVLPLSAKSEPALREGASRLAAHMRRHPELSPTDLAYSLATGRASLARRAALLGSERERLLAGLEAIAEGAGSPDAILAEAREGRLAYLLTGQGAQRLEMGAELHRTDPRFRVAFDAICEQLDPHLPTPLQKVVFAKGKRAAKRLEDTAFTQPALFALEVALHEALAERGLRPDLLAGHSIGELAAAHIAGVLSLPDAAKLVAARGRLMSALPEGGAMAAIEATEQELAESIEDRRDELAVAAVNGPAATVLSGAEEAVEELRAHWQERGRKTKRLAVSHAFHSPLMEPMLEEFAQIASGLSYREPRIPIISTLTGEPLAPEQATDPAYWVRQARETVRFADAVGTLAERGASVFLELGPDPVLAAMAQERLQGDEQRFAFLHTLREGRPEEGAIATAIGRAHAAGAKLEWEALFAGSGAKRVPLPTYPFQRRRFWIEGGMQAADASAIGLADPEHPLLGAALEGPEGESLTLTGRLSLKSHPWLADHAVAGNVLLPGTAFLELALSAAERVGAEQVRELTMQAPLVLDEQGAVQLQVTVMRFRGGGAPRGHLLAPRGRGGRRTLDPPRHRRPLPGAPLGARAARLLAPGGGRAPGRRRSLRASRRGRSALRPRLPGADRRLEAGGGGLCGDLPPGHPARGSGCLRHPPGAAGRGAARDRPRPRRVGRADAALLLGRRPSARGGRERAAGQARPPGRGGGLPRGLRSRGRPGRSGRLARPAAALPRSTGCGQASGGSARHRVAGGGPPRPDTGRREDPGMASCARPGPRRRGGLGGDRGGPEADPDIARRGTRHRLATGAGHPGRGRCGRR